jgi:predicted nucleic acid-binding protein
VRAVVDASVFVDGFRHDSRGAAARRALHEVEAWAPDIVDSEVMSAIARLERATELRRDEADSVIADWATVPVERVATSTLVPRAWMLRDAVRPSDAFYVVLARVLGCPLITSDARLSRAPLDDVTITLVR